MIRKFSIHFWFLNIFRDSVSIFGGANLPWTNADAQKISKENDPRNICYNNFLKTKLGLLECDCIFLKIIRHIPSYPSCFVFKKLQKKTF